MIFGVFVFYSEFCTLFIFLTLDAFMYDRAHRAYYTGCYTNLTDCGVNGCFTRDRLFTQPRCPSLSTQHLISTLFYTNKTSYNPQSFDSL